MSKGRIAWQVVSSLVTIIYMVLVYQRYDHFLATVLSCLLACQQLDIFIDGIRRSIAKDYGERLDALSKRLDVQSRRIDAYRGTHEWI